MNLLTPWVILWNRARYIPGERRRLATLERTRNSIRERHAHARENRMEHYERFYNVGLYLLTFESDMAILKNEALFSFDRWHRGYIARQLALLIYETTDDLSTLLGRPFRESLKTFPLQPGHWESINKIGKDLHKFKSVNHTLLNEIRNYVSAHREQDAETQLQIIEKIQLLDIMAIAGELYLVIRDLTAFMLEITPMLGEFGVMLRHAPLDKWAKRVE